MCEIVPTTTRSHRVKRRPNTRRYATGIVFTLGDGYPCASSPPPSRTAVGRRAGSRIYAAHIKVLTSDERRVRPKLGGINQTYDNIAADYANLMVCRCQSSHLLQMSSTAAVPMAPVSAHAVTHECVSLVGGPAGSAMRRAHFFKCVVHCSIVEHDPIRLGVYHSNVHSRFAAGIRIKTKLRSC